MQQLTARQMIAEIKKSTGWNTNQIALRIGISAPTLYRIEDGTSSPRELTVVPIERFWRKVKGRKNLTTEG